MILNFQQCIREGVQPEDNQLSVKLYQGIADFESAFDNDKLIIVWSSPHIRFAMGLLWGSKGEIFKEMFPKQEYFQRMKSGRKIKRMGRPALAIGQNDAPTAYNSALEWLRQNSPDDVYRARNATGGVELEGEGDSRMQPKPHVVKIGEVTVVFTQAKTWFDIKMGEGADKLDSGKNKTPWQHVILVDPEDMTNLIPVLSAVKQKDKIEPVETRERKSTYTKTDIDAPKAMRGKATAMTLVKAAKESGVRKGPDGVELGKAPTNLYPKIKAGIAAGQLKWGADGQLMLMETETFSMRPDDRSGNYKHNVGDIVTVRMPDYGEEQAEVLEQTKGGMNNQLWNHYMVKLQNGTELKVDEADILESAIESLVFMPTFKQYLVKETIGEKYFQWTDKSGRGEKPMELTKTHILETWDLEKQDDNIEVPLGEFMEDAYIGDVWQTHSEKLECIKIY